MIAGNREWCAKMHDDLLDTINHLVAQGIVDRECVTIYGGYAALIGATFTPDVFKCVKPENRLDFYHRGRPVPRRPPR